MDLHVVGIRYRGGNPAPGDSRGVGAYRASGVFEELAGADGMTFREPALPEARRGDDPIANLGVLGGEIADAVAEGARAGRPVVVVGGDCSHLPGVLGGLQDVHGPTARIGLVWFDAHGDFNTPRTTLSGMLGGMPVAVSVGLCYTPWREGAHQLVPLPTDRIVMVDVRNLDPDEERLIRATDVAIARVAPGFAGDLPVDEAVRQLAARCDHLYLHIDSDVLDASLTPNHGTREPFGPDVAQTLGAVRTVLETGKVVAFGLVSVNPEGAGGDVSMRAALDLLRGGLERWREARA
jgi:arginase